MARKDYSEKTEDKKVAAATGTDEAKDPKVDIPEDIAKKIIALEAQASELYEAAHELLVTYYTFVTPEDDDDEFIKKWAYFDASGKEQFADNRTAALALAADPETVRKAYVVPLKDGAGYRRITDDEILNYFGK